MKTITILGGLSKDRAAEPVQSLELSLGEIYAITGHTGSGKSRFIKDIEQLVCGDSVTQRTILIDGQAIPAAARRDFSGHMIAHLEQSMRFVLDLSVEDFILLHCRCRNQMQISPQQVIAQANRLTPEPISPEQNLNLLSGGQSRALMIADIAFVCDSPVVLIDEIENAGIDKKKALKLLTGQEKLVLIVTHDPHTSLMGQKRIVMKNGAMCGVMERTSQEEDLFRELDYYYEKQAVLQRKLREGVYLV
ncbi:MAG: ATP-binding cassette domain-containing protein [Lachnospiraceae bacterium]